MIVVDHDDPQQPQSQGDRSPLKSPSVTVRPSLAPPQPPPPYAATSSGHQASYHSVPPGQIPPPVAFVVVQEDSALKRFFKAWIVALFILFLWGMFVDSLNMMVRTNGNSIAGDVWNFVKSRNTIEWLVRDWYQPLQSATKTSPCNCLQNNVPTEPGRALPIAYPPVVSHPGAEASPILSFAVPLSSSIPS